MRENTAAYGCKPRVRQRTPAILIPREMISKYFSVSIDELLSSNEILNIAEEDGRKKEGVFRDTVFACLDLCVLV